MHYGCKVFLKIEIDRFVTVFLIYHYIIYHRIKDKKKPYFLIKPQNEQVKTPIL
jgi:hypothetical protein